MRDDILKSQSAAHMMIRQSQTHRTDHVFVWECCLSRASSSAANSCLASRDTWLGLGGGGGWSEISKNKEGRRKKYSKVRATQNCKLPHLKTRINCCTSTWNTWSEMKCIFWTVLHVMLEQDHHLFSTRSTTPQCAATAKARLSSLHCSVLGLPREGRHEQQRSTSWLYLCQGPQTILCNEVQKAKGCRECINVEHH